jgi:hypothetical protein
MVMGITRARRRAAAAAVVTCGGVAMLALVAACGSGANSPGASGTKSPGASSSVNPGGPAKSVSPSPSSSPASPATGSAKSQCATSDLVAKVARTAGGAAAGSSYVGLDFTNISTHSCVMFGYPGVSWVTGMRGSQIGDAAARTTGFPSVTVTLAPSGAAHAWLQIADAGNFAASSCHPVAAHWLRIIPPDQYHSLYAKFNSLACSGKITGGSQPLQVLPVRAGNAASGQVP